MLTLATLILAGGSTFGQPQPASMHAAPGPPVAIARTPTIALDAALETLPESTALAVVIPDPATLHRRWLHATQGTALEEWGPEHLRARVLQALALDDDSGSAGIDPHAAAIFVPGFSGAPDLVRVMLSDPAAFDAWAKARAAPDSQLDGAFFGLVSASGSPLACAPRQNVAWCQLGVSEGSDPLADLRRIVDVPSRRLAHLEGMERASQRLRRDSDLYILARPSALGELAGRAHLDRARRAQPFQAQKRSFDQDARREAAAVGRARRVGAGRGGRVDDR